MMRRKGGRLARLILVGVLGVATLAAATGSATASPAPPAPTSASTVTAEQQLAWVFDAAGRVPVSVEEQRRHLSETFLTGVGGPDKVNAVLAQVGPLTVRAAFVNTPTQIEAVAGGASGEWLVTLRLDTGRLVDGLFFQPRGAGPGKPAPQSWSELDTRLTALAPQVSFTAAEIDPSGGCHPVHGVHADTARPLGSAFKLYVLGALGQAVADHRASWDEPLAISERSKSLPSGILQNEPDGTKLPLREYANAMISISDNTATDHLIHRLGRDAVQAQLVRFGNHDPSADIPFLTTREMITLKGFRYPALADSYLSLPRPARAGMLAAVNRVPRPEITSWEEPRKVAEIEWFASPNDICRAYAGLWRQNARPGLAPTGQALSLNDGSIGLDHREYPTIWFKGGSEPGVLTLNYLAQSADGRVLVSSVMLSDPGRTIADAATAEAIALARGGIQLAS